MLRSTLGVLSLPGQETTLNRLNLRWIYKCYEQEEAGGFGNVMNAMKDWSAAGRSRYHIVAENSEINSRVGLLLWYSESRFDTQRKVRNVRHSFLALHIR